MWRKQKGGTSVIEMKKEFIDNLLFSRIENLKNYRIESYTYDRNY